MAVTAEFESNWLEMQDKYGAGIDSGEVPVLAPGDIDAAVTLPAVKFTAPYVEGGNNVFQDFRHVPMRTFVLAVQAQADAIKAAWELWFGTGDTSGIQKIWKDWYTATQDAWTTWFGTEPTSQSEGSGVKKEWATMRSNVQSATDAANAAVSQAQSVVNDAINATNSANQAAQAANTSRQQIETNEQTRQQNEQTRQNQESARVTAESNRVTEFSTIRTTAGSDHTRAETDHLTASGDHTTASADHTQAGQDHSTASSDHTQADADHTASVAATNAATNVNATLDGMTVTITDRTGASRSVDIGFEILEEHVYPSIAAMNADAANVLPGQFCMIATTDPTSADNAQLWTRNSSAATSAHPFTFLSDLDQASSAAWADWLNNKKPAIEAAIDQAALDHTQAVGDHSTASTDHTTATGDHTQAGQDHQQYATDHQTFLTNEAQRQQTFEDNEADRMAAMMLTRCFIDFATMSLMFVQPQADTTQYQVKHGNLNITFQYEA